MNKQRRAWEMHLQGRTAAEIGEELDATNAEVHSMLYVARKQAKRLAAAKDGEVVE